ncbi:hypothetical protein SO802_022062 [Lithocarpus litseifolius]|uniref:Prohibitin n=1 Tax=Lithocarpus litseifolius TaxID=425828 RepID=A0AAW2CHW0_9ROSI
MPLWDSAPPPPLSTHLSTPSTVANAPSSSIVSMEFSTRSSAKPHTFSSVSGTKDLQMVNLTLRVLSRPEVTCLYEIVQTLGLEYDEKVLPSIGNEVLKAVVAQFNTDQLLTERP